MKLTLLLLTLAQLYSMPLQAAPEPVMQSVPDWRTGSGELSLVAGLIQPMILQGGNVEVDLHWRRLAIGYSHGFLLRVAGIGIVGDASEQQLAYELPVSTGFSAGARLLSWLDVRAELKMHRFNVQYADQKRFSAPIFSYTTWTLGAGVYARWQPFASSIGWHRGIITSTSLRYWPNVASSLGGPSASRRYANTRTGKSEIHEVANIGIANTPFIFNISVGYTVPIF